MDVTLSEAFVKSLNEYITRHELRFSSKPTVRNNTSWAPRIVVEIQAINRDGFELKASYLRGDFSPGETKVLTDRQFIIEGNFKKAIKCRQVRFPTRTDPPVAVVKVARARGTIDRPTAFAHVYRPWPCKV